MKPEFEKQYEELELDNLLKSAGLIAAELEWEADQTRADDVSDPDPKRKELIWQQIERKLEKEKQKEKRKKLCAALSRAPWFWRLPSAPF